MYYGLGDGDSWIPSESASANVTTTKPFDWGGVAKQVGQTAQDILKTYTQMQLNKGLTKQQAAAQMAQARAEAQAAADEARRQAEVARGGAVNWTPWIIGGVVLAVLVVGGVIVLKKRRT